MKEEATFYVLGELHLFECCCSHHERYLVTQFIIWFFPLINLPFFRLCTIKCGLHLNAAYVDTDHWCRKSALQLQIKGLIWKGWPFSKYIQPSSKIYIGFLISTKPLSISTHYDTKPICRDIILAWDMYINPSLRTICCTFLYYQWVVMQFWALKAVPSSVFFLCCDIVQVNGTILNSRSQIYDTMNIKGEIV